MSHLVTVLSDLQKRGVAFLPLTEAIDTENAAGRLMEHILGALAEYERSLIVGGETTRCEIGAQAVAL